MTLAPGSRLGPYEILSPLGAGGMGEVYKARDTRLGREVAIKVLPEQLSTNAAALQRFETEAKAVAALSHSNILALHDFSIEGQVPFAVTELLAGETLGQRLEQGPVSWREIVRIGTQVCEGLAAAHSRGIVHRDLKPDNIFLTSDGSVKILDFGLARSSRIAPREVQNRALTSPMVTEPGFVVGTAAYMAPEQVRGLGTDARSDIFALGCVLYEMATGTRAFSHETTAETMAAILREEPEFPEESRALPPGLPSVIRHCLEKDPERRFQTARDLAFALETVSASSSRSAVVVAVDGSRKSRWNTTILAAIGLAALAGAFELGWSWARRAGLRGAAPHATFAQLTDAPGVERSPSLAPDGKSFVYVSPVSGNDDIYLQRVGGHNAVDLTADSPTADTAPAFSPDGERIAFRSERGGGGIFVMGATGESARRVTDFGYDPAWSPDGQELAVSTEAVSSPLERSAVSEVWAVKVSDGTRRLLHHGDAVQPSWSPHGRRIAFWGLHTGTGQRDIWTIPASSTEGRGIPVAVTDDAFVDWNPVWAPDGRAIYFSSDRGGTMGIWKVAIDEESGRTLGKPEPVPAPAGWAGGLSLSRDGKRIAFAVIEQRSDLKTVAFDPTRGTVTGTPRTILPGSRLIAHHALSGDGRWIAFTTGGLREDLFVVRSDGTGYRQLTDDAFRDRDPDWSPDGSKIAFFSNRGGRYEIWSIHPDGGGLEQISETSGRVLWSPLWSPDGAKIAVPDGHDTWILDLARARKERRGRPLPALPGGLGFLPTSWAPDGSSLAGWSIHGDGSSAEGIFVYTMATGSFRKISDVGAVPVWLPDRQRLLIARYGANSGLYLFDPRSPAPRLVLTVALDPNLGGDYSISLSRDGRQITYTETRREGDIWMASLP